MGLWIALMVGSALAMDPVVDPVIYPPDVHDSDPVTTGEVRVVGGGALVLRHTDVVVEVHAGVARTTMVQHFANPYDTPIEAVYKLPLPSDAAVDTMELTVGDRVIEGWVMERRAARQTYEDAKRDGKRAALLEQEQDNLFTQHVAGLCPGEHVTVTVQFSHQAEYEDGLYTVALPTTVGPKFSPPWVEDAEALDAPLGHTDRTVDITVYLQEDLPVETLYSDTHDITVTSEGSWGAMVGLVDDVAMPNRDFALTWSLAGQQPRAAVITHKPDPLEAGYAAVTIEPQLLDDWFQARPRELLFTVDSSCSMSGEPYKTATETVLRALESARPDDTFNLVRFASAASSLYDRPQRVTPTTLAAAKRWLAQPPRGGTHMDEGILHSLKMPGDPDSLRLVLMLTDGYVGGAGHMFDTVRSNLGDARLFSLGVGSSVNRYLLEGLAEMGRGDVAYHYPGRSSIEETVDGFYRRIAHPAMSDIAIDWGSVDVYDVYPERIPDLWAGQPIRVVARYEGGGPTTVEITGVVGTQTVAMRLPVDFPEADGRHQGLASLWARHRIRDIEWYPRGRTPDQVRSDILDTALEHNLVSKYTSLVAVDDQPCPCDVDLMTTQSVLHLPPESTRSVTEERPQKLPAGSGLGHRGSGLGGGGVLGTAGVVLGTKGLGGYGSGGSNFGSKGNSKGSLSPVGGEPHIVGGLSRTLIEQVIARHDNSIRYCYQRQLNQDPDLAGRLEVKFVIASDGTVTQVSLASSSLGNSLVETCVTGRFERMRFPTPSGGGIVVVRYPIRFQSG